MVFLWTYTLKTQTYGDQFWSTYLMLQHVWAHFKHGHFLPLSLFLKKGNCQDVTCYRPISLLDSTLIIMGRILLIRLETWAAENSILSDCQYCFGKGLGIVDQCLNLNLLISKYIFAKGGGGGDPSCIYGSTDQTMGLNAACNSWWANMEILKTSLLSSQWTRLFRS